MIGSINPCGVLTLYDKEERIKDNDILERINTYTICLKKFSETKKDVEQIKKYIKFRKP